MLPLDTSVKSSPDPLLLDVPLLDEGILLSLTGVPVAVEAKPNASELSLTAAAWVLLGDWLKSEVLLPRALLELPVSGIVPPIEAELLGVEMTLVVVAWLLTPGALPVALEDLRELATEMGRPATVLGLGFVAGPVS